MLLTHCKSIRIETVQHFKKSRFSFIIWCSDMKCFEMFSTQYIDATFQRSFCFSHHYLHTVKYKYENDLCYPYICILWAMSEACMIIRCICVLGICFFAFLASSFALQVIHSRYLMVWAKLVTLLIASQCSTRVLRAFSEACMIVSLHLHCYGYVLLHLTFI